MAYGNRPDEGLKAPARQLLGITQGCAHDMSDPEEQGVSAVGLGYDEDFDREVIMPGTFANVDGDGAMRLRLFRDHKPIGGFEAADINMAALVALARIGAASLLMDELLEGRI